MQVLDGLMICLYCGDAMNTLTKEQITMFGRPACCGHDMVIMDRSRLRTVVNALDKLKQNLEAKILEGLL